MDRRIFEENLLALSAAQARVNSRLFYRDSSSHYAFLKSRSGEIVPAILLPSTDTQPLHSMIDPIREAQRLVSTIPEDTGFIIFLGLGGGFAPEAALYSRAAHNCFSRIIVIDFDVDGIGELLSSKDYTKLFMDSRFLLYIDPCDDEIKKIISEQYKPALHGGIKIIPLRTRTDAALSKFERAAKVIEGAIENAASDYSVQAHFGKRWFSNIIRNLKAAEKTDNFFKINASAIREAAIIAAGPSLDRQIPILCEYKKNGVFIICSDTALPVLLNHGIEPDAAVSIDCQHISYHHFMGCDLRNIPLFLGLASPPLLCGFSLSPFFFCSGHPLELYISQYWRPLPRLDTSGGNVTYACLSLAEKLKIKRITFFGADFSYIGSRTYARGTYIYPFFEKKQNRLSPLEALFSAFLYRSPFLPKSWQGQAFYETSSLRFYREKIQDKASLMDAQIFAEKGQGVPVDFTRRMAHNSGNKIAPSIEGDFFPTGSAKMSAIEFLENYRDDIAALPEANGEGYLDVLSLKNRQVFTTMLPFAAAVKHRNPALKTGDLIEEAKRLCIEEITRVCNAPDLKPAVLFEDEDHD
jgi:hypothetical protein